MLDLGTVKAFIVVVDELGHCGRQNRPRHVAIFRGAKINIPLPLSERGNRATVKEAYSCFAFLVVLRRAWHGFSPPSVITSSLPPAQTAVGNFATELFLTVFKSKASLSTAS
jgi:hypothetical protein